MLSVRLYFSWISQKIQKIKKIINQRRKYLKFSFYIKKGENIPDDVFSG
jgi:hypothetical protein